MCHLGDRSNLKRLMMEKRSRLILTGERYTITSAFRKVLPPNGDLKPFLGGGGLAIEGDTGTVHRIFVRLLTEYPHVREFGVKFCAAGS
jgi:hypothetical protein